MQTVIWLLRILNSLSASFAMIITRPIWMRNIRKNKIINIKAMPVMIVTLQENPMTRVVLKYYLPFLKLLIPEILSAQEVLLCRINYLSKEHIYVNKGEDAGLSIGDTLIVNRNDQIIASLLIVYTSRYSASCQIIGSGKDLQVGDMAKFTLKEKQLPVTADPKTTLSITDNAITPGLRDRKPFARVSGGVSLQWYHFEDLSDHNLNFDQPTIRFTLKAREMWGKNYNFVVKTRLRRDERSRSYTTGAPKEEIRNRIYSFYFSYNDLTSLINYSIGRIHLNSMSGIGYLDGMLLQFNLSPLLHLGGYGGLQSSWQFAGAEPSLQKFGIFFNYTTGRFGSQRFETTLAFNNSYHGEIVNRENIYFQLNYMMNDRLSIYNSFDIDINRSWREKKAGKLFSLSSLYLSARYKFSDIVTAGLTFDDRKNYYTYETMEIPEEVYDMSARYGLRADLYLNFPQSYSASFHGGIKKRENDTQSTYVGRASLKKRNLFLKFLNVGMSVSGYSNYYTEGIIPSLNISKQFPSGHYISITAGQNNYKMKMYTEQRISRWIRLNGQVQLIGRTYFSGYCGYDWGNDVDGYRLLIELGYRF